MHVMIILIAEHLNAYHEDSYPKEYIGPSIIELNTSSPYR